MVNNIVIVQQHHNQRSEMAKRDRMVERMLDPLYKDERSPACFTSVEPLLQEARRVHPNE